MGAISNLGVMSDAQEISADDTPSTDTIDLAQATPQIGVGKPVFLCIRTAVAPTQAGDTLSIEVQQADDDGAGAPDSGDWGVVFMPLVGVNGAEVSAADARLATAGEWIWRCPLPYELVKRHIRLMYRNTTSTGVFTIDAYLSDRPPSDFDKQVWVSDVGNP